MASFFAKIRNSSTRLALSLFVVLVAAALVVLHSDKIFHAIAVVAGVIEPLIIGAVVAYLLNIIMSKLESIYFPNSKSKFVAKTRRPVCLIVTLVIVIAVLFGIGVIVTRQLSDVYAAVFIGLNNGIENLKIVFYGNPEMTRLLTSIPDWQSALMKAIEGLDASNSFLGSVLQLGKSVINGTIGLLVLIIFALYLLIDRERVLLGADNACKIILPKRAYSRFKHAVRVADECFSGFCAGQFLQGLILGLLCYVGMCALSLPYAAMTSLIIGVCAIIPLFGVIIGGAIGAVIMLSVSPTSALWFLVFFIVLYQIEGHTLYPIIVGKMVNTPGIWVLISVFVGAELFGLPGIIFGVPVVSTLRQLLIEWSKSRGKLSDKDQAENESSSPHDKDNASDDSSQPFDKAAANEQEGNVSADTSENAQPRLSASSEAAMKNAEARHVLKGSEE